MDRGGTRSDLSLGGTQTEVMDAGPSEPAPVLKLRLTKPKSDKKVEWKEGTVDNEHMNKKKSKCCCIYKKKLEFGESSSSDDEECEHCFGHPEKRTKVRKSKNADEQQQTVACQGNDAEAGDPMCWFRLEQDQKAAENESTEQLERTETPSPLPPLEPPSNKGPAENAKSLSNSAII